MKFSVSIDRIFLLIGCVLLFSGACTGSEITPSNVPATQTQQIPTTESPSTLTPISTVPLATATLRPTTPTTMPLTTALPTLTTEEIQAEILNLFQVRDTCKLPCFWGITPGKTTWEAAVSSLERVASRIDILTSSNEEMQGVVAWIDTPYEISSTKIVFNVISSNDVVKILKTRGFPNASSLFIPQFLESNGPPEEVWMHSFKSFPDNHPSVMFSLFYPSKGVLATYYADGEVIDGAIRACWIEAPNLVLWEPDRRLSYEEAFFITEYPHIEEPIGQYRRMKEATGVDINTFYTKNAGSADDVCLETPQSWWLDPYE